MFPGILDLTLNLRLAQYHRVQASGNAKKMRRRFAIAVHVHEFRHITAEPAERSEEKSDSASPDSSTA